MVTPKAMGVLSGRKEIRADKEGCEPMIFANEEFMMAPLVLLALMETDKRTCPTLSPTHEKSRLPFDPVTVKAGRLALLLLTKLAIIPLSKARRVSSLRETEALLTLLAALRLTWADTMSVPSRLSVMPDT